MNDRPGAAGRHRPAPARLGDPEHHGKPVQYGDRQHQAGADDYRPQIDGLRAVAILLVVAFHAGAAPLKGGFVGVDVFFVLSGFLITGLLAGELRRSGGIDLMQFYARRARRLLPALAVVMFAVLAAGTVLLPPAGERQELARSAIAAAAFVANVFFWRAQSSYFAGPSEERPLLHLWTLSVEEQFYIAWPLAIAATALLARRDAKRTVSLVALALVPACAVSFAACWLLTPLRGNLVFFTLPFRAWELGAGAILALAPISAGRTDPGRCAGCALLVAGLGAILAAGHLFSSATMFPGSAAALPVIGTVAALAGLGMAPGSAPARLLAARPMVAIGKLSYSWYLWHWPLLALARAAAPDAHAVWRDGALVLVALALSAATYRWVEDPVRRGRTLWPTRAAASVASGLALLMACAAVAAGTWQAADRIAERDPLLRAIVNARTETITVPTECTHFRQPYVTLAPAATCTLNAAASGATLVLWGDSHAFHYLPALADWAQRSGNRVLPRTMGGCRPHETGPPAGSLAWAYDATDGCKAFNSAVRQSIGEASGGGATIVGLAARWSAAAAGPSGKRHDWEPDLRRLVASLRADGLGVVLIAEVPRPRVDIPACLSRHGAGRCDRPRGEVDAERAAAVAILAGIAAANPGVSLLDPIDANCTRQTCPAVIDGVVLYRDASHLSVSGARRLGPVLGDHIQRFLQSLATAPAL